MGSCQQAQGEQSLQKRHPFPSIKALPFVLKGKWCFLSVPYRSPRAYDTPVEFAPLGDQKVVLYLAFLTNGAVDASSAQMGSRQQAQGEQSLQERHPLPSIKALPFSLKGKWVLFERALQVT